MIELNNDIIKVCINEMGAEVTSVIKNEKEYIWQKDPKVWNRQTPVLFPIVGALKDGKYSYENREYEMGQHGFARDMEFEVLKKDREQATFALYYNQETLAKYPFKFEFLITYKLVNDELEINYNIINVDAKEIYYSIGAHPGFSIDINNNQYSFEIKAPKYRYDLKEGLIGDKREVTTEVYEITKDTFKDDALIFEPSEKEITLLENQKPLVKMQYDDFRFMGVWGVHQDTLPFVCLEPWNGIADLFKNESRDISNKFAINKLKTKEEDIFKYKIKFY